MGEKAKDFVERNYMNSGEWGGPAYIDLEDAKIVVEIAHLEGVIAGLELAYKASPSEHLIKYRRVYSIKLIRLMKSLQYAR